MADASWSTADVAKALCDALVASGKLRANPSFIREDREAKIASVFEAAGLDGAKLLSFSNPRELEVLIRSNTEGESWVDDVQEGMKNMMSAEAAAAAPKIELSEEAKAATNSAQTRFHEAAANPDAGPPQGGGGGGGGFGGNGFGGGGFNPFGGGHQQGPPRQKKKRKAPSPPPPPPPKPVEKKNWKIVSREQGAERQGATVEIITRERDLPGTKMVQVEIVENICYKAQVQCQENIVERKRRPKGAKNEDL